METFDFETEACGSVGRHNTITPYAVTATDKEHILDFYRSVVLKESVFLLEFRTRILVLCSYCKGIIPRLGKNTVESGGIFAACRILCP